MRLFSLALAAASRSRRQGHELAIVNDAAAARAVAETLAQALAALPPARRLLLLSDAACLRRALERRAETGRAALAALGEDIKRRDRARSVCRTYQSAGRP